MINRTTPIVLSPQEFRESFHGIIDTLIPKDMDDTSFSRDMDAARSDRSRLSEFWEAMNNLFSVDRGAQFDGPQEITQRVYEQNAYSALSVHGLKKLSIAIRPYEQARRQSLLVLLNEANRLGVYDYAPDVISLKGADGREYTLDNLPETELADTIKGVLADMSERSQEDNQPTEDTPVPMTQSAMNRLYLKTAATLNVEQETFVAPPYPMSANFLVKELNKMFKKLLNRGNSKDNSINDIFDTDNAKDVRNGPQQKEREWDFDPSHGDQKGQEYESGIRTQAPTSGIISTDNYFGIL
jgi:hypothetical protein